MRYLHDLDLLARQHLRKDRTIDCLNRNGVFVERKKNSRIDDRSHRSPSARDSTGAVISMVVTSQISIEAGELCCRPRTRS